MGLSLLKKAFFGWSFLAKICDIHAAPAPTTSIWLLGAPPALTGDPRIGLRVADWGLAPGGAPGVPPGADTPLGPPRTGDVIVGVIRPRSMNPATAIKRNDWITLLFSFS